MNAPINTAPTMNDRDRILAALRAFAEQRPGMDPRNYGDWASYRSESRSITRDLHHARELLAYVQRSSMSAETLRASFDAYSGRLTLGERDGRMALDYCTGQYFPTEYRRAVCAVLAAACWSYWRDECMPAPDLNLTTGERTYDGKSAGDYLRACARRNLGATSARRWFN